MPSEPAELANDAPHPMPVRGMPTTTRGDDPVSDSQITISIDKDEWYPVYSVGVGDRAYGTKCTIPESLFGRAVAAFAEFEAVQQELEKFYEATA